MLQSRGLVRLQQLPGADADEGGPAGGKAGPGLHRITCLDVVLTGQGVVEGVAAGGQHMAQALLQALGSQQA